MYKYFPLNRKNNGKYDKKNSYYLLDIPYFPFNRKIKNKIWKLFVIGNTFPLTKMLKENKLNDNNNNNNKVDYKNDNNKMNDLWWTDLINVPSKIHQNLG